MAAAFCGVLAPAASAAIIRVTTTADEFNTNSAACSLREAIQAGDTDTAFGGCAAGVSGDTILVPGGNYRLAIAGVENSNAAGDLDVGAGGSGAALSIVHNDASRATIDGNNLDRVIDVLSSGSTLISGFNIVGGSSTGNGGGIEAVAAALTLRDDTISGNASASNGGGVYDCCGGSTSFENVTISGNRATVNGGGLDTCCGSADHLNNVTISANTAASAGANADGGGLFNCCGGSTSLQNTIVAGNTDASASGPVAPDCLPQTMTGGELDSFGHNLIGNPSGCTFTSAAGDQTGKDAMLAPLGDNGGPVATMALRAGSPAIDAGAADPVSACAARDARGTLRPQGAGCDIGAFELVPSPAVPAAGSCAGKTATITGTAGNDKLKGTAKADVIDAQGGNDNVSGLGGKDLLCGGAGNDKLVGGGGADTLLGGAGKDTLSGGGGKDKLKGQAGRDSCAGGGGKDSAAGCETKTKVP